MQVTFSPWEREDIDEIAALEQACFSDAWTKEQLESAWALPTFIGLKIRDNGVIVGYLCGSRVWEDGELWIIAVAKERRREGLGGALLNEFLRKLQADGAQRVFLEVRASNTAAQALYTRCGFQRTRVRERYYGDGETAFEMVKTI